MTGAPDYKAKKRRRRKRKARVAVIPVASSIPAPPDPGPILGEREEKALRAVEDEDAGILSPARPKVVTVTAELPIRDGEILAWYARVMGKSEKAATAELLRNAIAKLKPSYREAMTGTNGGTTRTIPD